MAAIKIVSLDDARRAFREEAKILTETLTKTQDPAPSNSVLSSAGVQRELNVSRATLSRWRTEGRIRFSKIGSKLFYRREDIENLIQSNVVTQGVG